MTREDIKRAAEQNISCHTEFDFTEILVNLGRECFCYGAEWRIDSVWHDMSDKPSGIFAVLVDFGNEEYSLGITLDGMESGKRWAYIANLLPDGKEE